MDESFSPLNSSNVCTQIDFRPVSFRLIDSILAERGEKEESKQKLFSGPPTDVICLTICCPLPSKLHDEHRAGSLFSLNESLRAFVLADCSA
jgi:hypothetical protein